MTTAMTSITKIAGVTEVVRAAAGTTPESSFLSLGEAVEATVIKALPDNRYLLNIKNASLSADSQLKLTAGEKITVQVEKLTPAVVLRVISSTQAEAGIINKHLLLHRSNPAALGELFSKIGEMTAGAKTLPPALETVGANLEKISRLSEKIMISGINRTYVNNMTDYGKSLGLNMEHGLVRLLVQGEKISKSEDRTSVKRLFMDILSSLNDFIDNGAGIDDALLNRLSQLRTFSEESISTLETHQILNVVSRESDGPFILQLPFAFPEGVRMQNVYIEREQEQGNEETKAALFRMMIFLDLDRLGEITLDARFKDKRIDCVFQCQDEESAHFMGACLSELKERLAAAGYDVGGLQCLVEENLQLLRHEYLYRQPFYNRMALNLFA